MNFKKLGITLALTAGITSVGVINSSTIASAHTPTFPKHMRGTWHTYSYGSFETERFTKHSDHFYGEPKVQPWNLEIGHVLTRNGRIGYVPRWKDQSAAYSYYVPTKIKLHGHHYRALIVNGSDVYTHFHTKHHFKVSHGYWMKKELD